MSMLRFKEVQLSDQDICKKYLDRVNYHFCEHCFTDIFVWGCHYYTEIAFAGEFMFVKMSSFPEKIPMYLMPIGAGNLEDAVSLIIDDSKGSSIPFMMLSVGEENKAYFERKCPDKFIFTENRDGSDYVYLSEKMITLSGKKLHAKRNFINRFKTMYQNRWQYIDVSSDNIDRVSEYHEKWYEDNGCSAQGSFKGEACAVKRAIKNFDQLGIKGGMLTIDGKVVAYAMGCRSSYDMFVIQFEKADHDINGAYPVINNEFAKRHCTECKYINREEDMGIEGLRKAKLSYHPEMINVKYIATLKDWK